MNSSPSKLRPSVLLLGVLGLAYPFAVFALLGRVPAGALVLAALALVAGRLLALRRSAPARAMAPALAGVLAVTGALSLADPRIAALAYPVLMSLGMAAAFGLSLLFPPSLVEALASLSEPSPSPRARAYMRTVSLVWCLFLTLNAGLSAVTAWLGDIGLWTLYNGLISYLLMGALFGGEFMVRRHIQAREAAP